jgi:ATP-dependent helicase/DNAse subunit B
MNTKLTLSHSQIEAFEQCARRWYLTKVVKVPQAPSDALILGIAFHAALEAYGKLISGKASFPMPNGEQLQTINRGAIKRFALDALNNALDEKDPHHLIPIIARDIMHTRLMSMLDQFWRVRVSIPLYRPAYRTTLEVEQPFTFAINDEITFTGIIDAIASPRGAVNAVASPRIADWKTANSLTKWRTADLDHKDQATAYLIARPEAAKVTFVVFACAPTAPETCDIQSFTTTRTLEQKQAYLRKVERIAGWMQEMRTSGHAPETRTLLCGDESQLH